MSTPYFIAPDGQDNPTLWMETDSPSQPLAVASLYQDHLVSDDLEVAAILWHAGTAVLAPSEEQIEAVARAKYARAHRRCGEPGDPDEVWDRSPDGPKVHYRDEARADLAALAAHAEGAAT